MSAYNNNSITKNILLKDVLNICREQSCSIREQGSLFEILMQRFMLTDPAYSKILTDVWLWHDFPYKNDFGGKDIGIDLVAKTKAGDYWAIQCKCYDEDASISKASVDTFLATSSKQFKIAENTWLSFTNRIWIATTNNWTSTAEIVLKNQVPPVNILDLSYLENAPVNWEQILNGNAGQQARRNKKEPRPHQITAIEKCHEHFQKADRGKLIMACGTGKTFTALKIAEKETNNSGLVLFMVPSIALLSQTLNEWLAEAEKSIDAICVCSDASVSQKDDEDLSIANLPLPASTNVESIKKQYKNIKSNKTDGMTVLFSTYQSIDVISQAQKELNQIHKGSCIFDLIICDEAHRTTGVTTKDRNESAFVKIHNDDNVYAKKRVYMTATPRLYSEESKSKAEAREAILCSMDDESLYGKEIYRLGFSEAVEKGLLSDYKVLILTISEDKMPEVFQNVISNTEQEINADNASKLIGCINALSKKLLVDAELLKHTDPNPMHKAVAYCQNIRASQTIVNTFNDYKDVYYESLSDIEKEEIVQIEADHVDGSMGAFTRNQKLKWLKCTTNPHV